MLVRQKIKQIVERVAGARFYRTVPRAIAPFADLAFLVPHLRIDVIFDVGANIRQSALNYLTRLPAAEI